MRYFKAKNRDEALEHLNENPSDYLFCGGTDLALKLKRSSVDGVIDISALDEFDFIHVDSNEIKIGALTTLSTILENEDIKHQLPILHEASSSFASHQIRNIATIGGNIANDSPVADMIAPLLVLRTTVTLGGLDKERTIPLEELFDGFKHLTLKNEIIISLNIPLQKHQYYYRKVGSREKLNISKLSLAMLKNEDGFFMSGASVNPYITRFFNLEKLLNSAEVDDSKILDTLQKDISPSGSFRSTKEYRVKVMFNMIKDALKSFEVE